MRIWAAFGLVRKFFGVNGTLQVEILSLFRTLSDSVGVFRTLSDSVGLYWASFVVLAPGQWTLQWTKHV